MSIEKSAASYLKLRMQGKQVASLSLTLYRTHIDTHTLSLSHTHKMCLGRRHVCEREGVCVFM